MLDSEDDVLVYLAGSVGAEPDGKEKFLAILAERGRKFSDKFNRAVQELFTLSEKAERQSSPSLPYRRALVELARDCVAVSISDPKFPLNAAKFAILTACDYR